MKFFHTPNLTILNTSLNKVYNNIVRDFEEAKHFREYEKSKSYLGKMVYYIEKNVLENLLTLKKNFSHQTTTGGKIEGQDISNYFIVDASLGVENIYYKSNQFTVSASIARDGKIISTILYNPVKNETIACEKDFGLLYNNQKIRHLALEKNSYNKVVVEQSVLQELETKQIYNHKLEISTALELEVALACAKRILGVVLSKQSYENSLNSYCKLLIEESKIPVKQVGNVVVLGNIEI